MGEELSNFREAHESSQKLEMKIDKLENNILTKDLTISKLQKELSILTKENELSKNERIMFETVSHAINAKSEKVESELKHLNELIVGLSSQNQNLQAEINNVMREILKQTNSTSEDNDDTNS